MPRRALPLLLAALACNPGFDPQYRVTDLRILAVSARVAGSADAGGVARADPDPTSTLELTALVLNPRGRAGLDVTWYACVPAVNGLSPCVEPSVLQDPSGLAAAGAFPLGSGTPVPGQADAYAAPAIALSALPAEVQAAMADALQAARRQADLQPTYQCRVYVELPVVVIAAAEGKRVAALKRVRLVQTDPRPPYDGYVVNHDPVVDGAYRAPADPDACSGGTSIDPAVAPFPRGRTTLCARASGASPPETYLLCAADGARQSHAETYDFQWYVSDGTFPDEGGLGNATGTSLDFERPDGAFTLWLILRDGRGGDAWRRIDVAAAP